MDLEEIWADETGLHGRTCVDCNYDGGDFLGARFTIWLALLCQAAALLVFTQADTFASSAVAAAIYGFGYGVFEGNVIHIKLNFLIFFNGHLMP